MIQQNEREIDKAIEQTMDGSDAPVFTDPKKKEHGIEAMFKPIEALRQKVMPTSIQQKINDASAALDAYHRGKLEEEKAIAIIQAVREDPEVHPYL